MDLASLKRDLLSLKRSLVADEDALQRSDWPADHSTRQQPHSRNHHEVSASAHALDSKLISGAAPGASGSVAADIPPLLLESDVRKQVTRDMWESMPPRIILVRTADYQGKVNDVCFGSQPTPDPYVPLTAQGEAESWVAGKVLARKLSQLHGGDDFKLFVLMSPYTRAVQTYQFLAQAFKPEHIIGIRQEVQLRAQDFGNGVDPSARSTLMRDRRSYGRFWYRFLAGESGADVYDRCTMLQSRLLRDVKMERYSGQTLLLVTHGLTLRVFLMRWFHWTVDQFLQLSNPPSVYPIVLEKLPWERVEAMMATREYVKTRQMYRLDDESARHVNATVPGMCEMAP